jgi:hypothetical protein
MAGGSGAAGIVVAAGGFVLRDTAVADAEGGGPNRGAAVARSDPASQACADKYHHFNLALGKRRLTGVKKKKAPTFTKTRAFFLYWRTRGIYGYRLIECEVINKS